MDKNENEYNKNNLMKNKGTIKVDKIHYLMRKDDKKLFEDINLQYIEPLEGDDEHSENADISYNKYLKGVNKELSVKKEEITFINDLGLNDNLLNIKDLFDKIKKQNKIKILKTQNSHRSFNYNKIIIKNKCNDGDIIDIEEEQNLNFNKKNKEKKEIIEKKEKRKNRKKIKNKKLDISIGLIKKALLSKMEIKKYMNIKRIMTYNNKINDYKNKKEIMLNINEKKKNLRRINSGRIYQKIEKLKREKEEKNENYKKNKINKQLNENESDSNEEDIFGNKKKKKNDIVELFYLLDDEEEEQEEEEEKVNDSRKSGIIIKKIEVKPKNEIKNNINNNNNNEVKEEIKEEEKKEGYVHPLVKLEQDIKKMNMKQKKKKKNPPPPPPIPEPKKEDKNKKKNLFLIKKSNIFKSKYKETNNGKNENNYNKNNRLKSPAINSILNDISSLSKLVINKAKDNKNGKIKNNNIYKKHFGYEYWKENEFRKTILCSLSSQKRGFSSFKSVNSTIAPDDNYSVNSSNFSWLLKKNNEKYNEDEYNDIFSLKMKENFCNPYSLNWTKTILKNSYNKKLKLKKHINGIPEIELLSRSKSSLSFLQPNLNYNFRNFVDNKNNNFFKKNNNMYGRIYNNNEVEFPFIYKS